MMMTDSLDEKEFEISQFERIGSLLPNGMRVESLLLADQIRSQYLASHPDHAGTMFVVQVFRNSGPPSNEKGGSDFELNERNDRVRQILAKLTQVRVQGLTKLIDAGFTDAGEVFLVQEKSLGRDLGAVLRERQALKVETTLEIGDHAAAILAELERAGYAHGMMHRGAIRYIDDAEMCVEITDFGVRQVLTALEPENAVIGAPLYMPPEQFRRQRSSFPGDVFSLCAIMFECITGSPPHSYGELSSISRARKFSASPTLNEFTQSKYSIELEALFQRGLEPDPTKRIQQASELQPILRKLRIGKTVEPAAKPENLAHEYKLVHSLSRQDLHALQNVDLERLEASERQEQRRQRQMLNIYGATAAIAFIIYGATLLCLGTMRETNQPARQSVDNATESKLAGQGAGSRAFGNTTTGSSSSTDNDGDESKVRKSFMSNPPSLSSGELSGKNMNLSTILKFSSPYTLYADECVGNFAEIAELDQLERLSLRNTQVSDRDLELFKQLPLSFVDLSRCPEVSSTGIQLMAALPTMRIFAAEGVHVQATDIDKFNPAMFELQLQDCNLNDDAVDPLLNLKDLGKLFIAQNNISLAALKKLHALKHLHYLDVRGNKKLKPEQMLALTEALPNTAIRFNSGPNESTNHRFHLVDRVKQCYGLSLDAAHTKGDYSCVTTLKHLQELSLAGSAIKDEDMGEFARLPLRAIDINGDDVHAAGLEKLKNIGSLIVFKASGAKLHDEDLLALNPNLVELNLSSCKITDNGVASLTRLKNLREISMHNTPITPDSLKHFRNMKGLRLLEIHDCPNLPPTESRKFEKSMSNLVVVLNKARY